MKKLAFVTLGIMVFVVCISAVSKETTPSAISLEGVWDLEHQYLYEEGQIQDTLQNLDGYRQVKMYSKGKVMWTRYNPADSNEWFGYGNYTIKDGILEERLEYASNSMMEIIDTVQVFRFELEKERNRYSQISLDEDGNRYISENYKRVK